MELFSLKGKTAVLTGGGGMLAGGMARAFARAGAKIALCDIHHAAEAAERLRAEGFDVRGYEANALDRDALRHCRDKVLSDLGSVDILVNAAGGNQKEATTSPELNFFNLPLNALEKVVALNLFAGAILPAQVFGESMVKQPAGASIINISSMNAFRPLTRIPGYSAAKAAVSNFTQWLAAHLAQEYNPKIRVNAIAPGFFLTDQNRFLLTNETGQLTQRGQQILSHTPAGRFGEAEDLDGTALWLASDASRFVTGVVVPVDGGFNAYSGV